jgi:hypothetical protein
MHRLCGCPPLSVLADTPIAMNVATLTGLLLPDEPGLSCYVQYVDGEGQAGNAPGGSSVFMAVVTVVQRRDRLDCAM